MDNKQYMKQYYLNHKMESREYRIKHAISIAERMKRYRSTNKAKKRRRELYKEKFPKKNYETILKSLTKSCIKCKLEKSKLEFYKNHREKDGLQSICKSCFKDYVIKNREKLRVYSKNYYLKNEDKWRKNGKEYRLRNADLIKRKKKEYYSTDRAKEIKRINSTRYVKERYRSDSDFRLGMVLRSRVRMALRRKDSTRKNVKYGKTLDLVGCSVEFLKNHLQKTAISNRYFDFDINNYDGRKYHIDHKVPCVSFDLSKPEEQKKCFNWTNLQILKSEENLKKSDFFVN